MKRIILLSFILFANFVLAFVPIKITPDFTDTQLREAEKRAFDHLGVKVEVEVFSRDEAGRIEKVKISRFHKDGRLATSCSSDLLEELAITEGGCWIKDRERKK
ncbi:hypothetical protein [Lacihabitans soyangensis]|uniref:Uncharacterized protein n=1 Tax=Lacihabitans soyangensis TaxID=869394 RepID=A0AAE3H866_9BACT|nr:hypothetical protein [Lacihabitans soyangensis]MCP9765959.1 hypothetical protein [Lacihabitans soyangensis]